MNAFDTAAQSITPGIVHFGPGNFFKGHWAVIIDDYIKRTGDARMGIIGVTLRDPDKLCRMRASGFKYHVIARDATGEDAPRLVSSMVGMLHAPHDPEAVVTQIAKPETKVVSMTITQNGYTADDNFLGSEPKTVAGYIVRALDRRKDNGLGGLTLLSLDNMPSNGDALKKAVMMLAANVDGLPAWIEENVKFPNTMVDRIVPQPTPENHAEILKNHNLVDGNAIFTERFGPQLVIGGDLADGFPDIKAQKGVSFTDRVHNYELMKIRMLNGCHFAMGVIGTQFGEDVLDTALNNDMLRSFAEGFLNEASRSLPEIPDVDYKEYAKVLFSRFENPHMDDQLIRLARDGTAKINPRVLGVARDLFAKGEMPRHMIFTAAAWTCFLARENINDKTAGERGLSGLVRDIGENAWAIINLSDVFGKDLRSNRAFSDLYREYVTIIHRNGIEHALKVFMSSSNTSDMSHIHRIGSNGAGTDVRYAVS